jgi:hypothetical protein
MLQYSLASITASDWDSASFHMSHCCTGVAHAAVPCPKRLYICPLLAIRPPGVPWRFARLRHVNSAASFPYMRRVLTPTGVYAVDVRRTLACAMCVVLKLYACL